MSRPTKLNQVKEILLASIKEGLTLKAACRCAGISYPAFSSWKRKAAQALAKGQENEYSVLIKEIENEHDKLQQTRLCYEKRNLTRRDRRYWGDPFKSEARIAQRKAYLRAKEKNFELCKCQSNT
jgi:hypothetical protein